MRRRFDLIGFVLVVAGLAVALFRPAEARAAEASGELAVWHSGAWRTWWRAESAPSRWNAADARWMAALRWQPLAPGLEWASVRMRCGAPAWRARIVVARVDPRRIRLSLAMPRSADAKPSWTIDRAPEDALLALNAGQFDGVMPWGWVVVDGVQQLSPGHGPLASAVSIDGSGHVRWTHGGAVPGMPGVVTAFQSYPTLLAGDGIVPAPLRSSVGGVSLTHRDARLALGQTRDGMLLFVMTRFDAAGEMAGNVPLGPTTPEMAAILGALGACDAVMLDGGISAQMLLRDPERVLRWAGLRKVPLALIGRACEETAAAR